MKVGKTTTVNLKNKTYPLIYLLSLLAESEIEQNNQYTFLNFQKSNRKKILKINELGSGLKKTTYDFGCAEFLYRMNRAGETGCQGILIN